MLNEWGIHTNLLAQCEHTLESVQNRLKELRKQHALLTENSTKIYNELNKFHFKFETDQRNKNKKEKNETGDHCQEEAAATAVDDCAQSHISRIQRSEAEIDREEPTRFTTFYTPRYPPTLPRKRRIPAVDPGRHPHGMWKVLAHDAKERVHQSRPRDNFIEMLNGSNYSDADPFVMVGKISPPLHPEAQKLLEVQKMFPNPIAGNLRATISWNKSSEDALARLVSALGLGAFSSLNDSQQQLSELQADYPTTAHFALESCRELPQAEQWEFITQVLENMGGGVDAKLVPTPGQEQYWKTLTQNTAPLSTNEVTLHYMNTMEKRHQLDDFTTEEDRCIVACVTDVYAGAYDHFSGFTNQGALRELQAIRPEFVDEGVMAEHGGSAVRTWFSLRKGINCWVAIAALLGTNRSAFSCLQRFQRSLRRGLFIKGNNRTPYSVKGNVVALNYIVRSIIRVYYPSTGHTHFAHPPYNRSYHSIEAQAVTHAMVETILESGKSHGFTSTDEVWRYLESLDAFPLGNLQGTTTIAVITFICTALYLDAIVTKNLTVCKEQRHRMESYLEEANIFLNPGSEPADSGEERLPLFDVAFGQALGKGLGRIDQPALGFIISRMRFNVGEEYKLRMALLADSLTATEARKHFTSTKKTSALSGVTTTTNAANTSHTNIDRLSVTTRRYLLKGVRARASLNRSPVNDVILNAIAARLQAVGKL